VLVGVQGIAHGKDRLVLTDPAIHFTAPTPLASAAPTSQRTVSISFWARTPANSLCRMLGLAPVNEDNTNFLAETLLE
jgi:hypothetical protein